MQCFLVMYLMGLKLWTLGAAIGPLLANVGSSRWWWTVLIAVFVLFRGWGEDDAAVTVGGFLGFGLSSMPVAMATMDSVAQRIPGPSPKAFLLIALAGSFFVDLANAFIVKGIPDPALVSLKAAPGTAGTPGRAKSVTHVAVRPPTEIVQRFLELGGEKRPNSWR